MSRRAGIGGTAALFDAGPPARRQVAGAVAQDNGEEGEAVADRMHDLCFRMGVAEVDRVSSHIKIGRPTGRSPSEHYAYVKPGPGVVDCVGEMADGRAVKVEVKGLREAMRESGTGPAPLRLDLARVKPHQRAQLARCGARGGVALVLCPVHDALVFAVPWSACAAVLAEGRGSLSEEELRAWRCEPGKAYLGRWARG